MFGNRPEFHLGDLAAMTLGATPFSIYQTYTPNQIQYIVSDAGGTVAIIEAGVPGTRARGAPGPARASST